MGAVLALVRRALAIGLVLLMPPVLVAYLGEQGIPGLTWATLARIGWPWCVYAGAAAGMAGALLWPWIARGIDESRFHAWADLIVRRTLTLIFLTYGLSKLFRLQFYEPYYHWQETAAGDLTGFELTWYYFGASYAYSVFVGLGEILAAVLLLFRRTSLLGAVLLAMIGANILAVNVAYGIGVAHFAGLMLVADAYLLVSEWPRLRSFFLGTGAAAAMRGPDPLLAAGAGRSIQVVTTIVAVLVPIADKVRDVPRGTAVSMDLTGAWTIIDQSAAGSEAGNTEVWPWDRIAFEKNFGGTQVAVWVGDSLARGRFRADTVARTIRISVTDHPIEPAFTGRWTMEGDSIATLLGSAGNDSITLVLKRLR